MKIILAGGTGFVGKAIVNSNLINAEWVVFTRNPSENISGAKMVYWDGETLGPWQTELESSDVLINLSGKSVDCRYNKGNKAVIFSSRLNSTRILGKALSNCTNPPKVWMNAASATIYRHSEDKAMDETTGEYGEGFSVQVCQQWEKAFFNCKISGIRQIALRTAIVLGSDGGVMKPFRNLAKFGMAGRMGSGKQMFSWMHEKDFVRAIDFIIKNDNISGSVNMCSPSPVSNTILMKSLRKAVGFPWGIPTPKWLLEIGAFFINTETELILKSRWVLPKKLVDAGFVFEIPEIEDAVHHLINKRNGH